MAKFKIRVEVNLKEGVHDPQGETIKNALLNLGYSEISSVKTAKLFYLEIEAASESTALVGANQMAAKLLANPVIEKYSVELCR